MWAKIAASFAAPILAVALVVVVLVGSHHTSVPPFTLPSVSSASVTTSSSESSSASSHRCLGAVSKHFAGLAVKKRIAVNTTTFAQATGHGPQIVEFYNPFTQPFAKGEVQTVIRAGEIPLIQLNPKGAPATEIAAGKFDSS